jgi:hypothetical protein
MDGFWLWTKGFSKGIAALLAEKKPQSRGKRHHLRPEDEILNILLMSELVEKFRRSVRV